MTKARDLADRTAADLTAVTAGTGISITDGTGPIPTVTNTVATGFDAKGDLIVGTGADTFAKLTVASTAGYLLSVDSGETTGLKWSAPAGGGYTLINTGGTALSGSSTGVTSIPNTYKDLIIQVVDYYPNADADITLYFNNDNNSGNYQGIGFRSSTNSVDNGSRNLTGNQINNSSSENTATIYIPNYANTDAYKLCYHMARARNDGNTAYNIGFYVTGWNNTDAIDSFYLAAVSSTFSGGTMYVYGVK